MCLVLNFEVNLIVIKAKIPENKPTTTKFTRINGQTRVSFRSDKLVNVQYSNCGIYWSCKPWPPLLKGKEQGIISRKLPRNSSIRITEIDISKVNSNVQIIFITMITKLSYEYCDTDGGIWQIEMIQNWQNQFLNPFVYFLKISGELWKFWQRIVSF